MPPRRTGSDHPQWKGGHATTSPGGPDAPHSEGKRTVYGEITSSPERDVAIPDTTEASGARLTGTGKHRRTLRDWRTEQYREPVSGNGQQTRTMALIPARNEAATIGRVIRLLREQTERVDGIVVICDNCTDNTADIARSFGVRVMQTTGNTHKKAGALNHALEKILPVLNDEDTVLVQDADSFLDPHFVEVTHAKLREGFGAAGGNFRGREEGGLCGALQRNEYVRYARDVKRKNGDVLCITGVGTLFSVGALRDVMYGIRCGYLPDANGGYCYAYSSLTEDNWMTLALKHLGYKVCSPAEAVMTTEVMLSWRALAVQRIRWKRGAIEDLIQYGITKHTLKGWGLQAVSVLGVLATLMYFGTLLATPWLGFHIHWLFVGFTIIYAVERAVTVRERGWRVSLLSMTVVGEWMFDIFLQMCQIKAIYKAARRAAGEWGV